MEQHAERKHSKFSASGAERWFKCSGSVALSEGVPSKENKWSVEGTQAHEVLESIVTKWQAPPNTPKDMLQFAENAARFILDLQKKNPLSDLLVEKRVLLDFIHPEAFGSLDYAVVGYFGRLEILDFKYGKWLVSPKENLQFLFYALAVANIYDWNFETVRMWALQPRVKNFDGYNYWQITIDELRAYIPMFKKAIEQVEKYPNKYVEGEYCFFCPAKSKCPLKNEAKANKSRAAFLAAPIGVY